MGILKTLFGSSNKKPVETTTKESKQIAKKTIKQQLYRFNQEIENWKQGLASFEDVFNSTNSDLIRVYNDIMIDSHLTALIETRISKTLSKDFKIIDDKGKEIDDETKLFHKKWFRDFVRLALESKFYGFSLVQFGDRVADSFEDVSLVPREYVNAAQKGVRQSPYSNEPLTPFTTGEFSAWLLGIGKPHDSGLLMKAAPMVIYKKTAMGSWTEFTELFGTPFRLGKTDVRDDVLRNNMFEMLENMGRNAYGVFDNDDSLEFISDGKTDAFQVYNELIARTNTELSKLILGSTMTNDDGSSRSQSEVHERTTAALIKDDAFFIEDIVNNQLIPFLNQFHGFNISGAWAFDDTEQTPKEEQFKRDIELIKLGFDVPASYLTETYGTPIDGKTEPEPKDPTQGPNTDTEKDADNGLKKKSLLNSLIQNSTSKHSCGAVNEFASEDFAEPDFSDSEADAILRGIYEGAITANALPVDLYEKIASHIMGGVYNGIDASGQTLATIADKNFVSALQNNAFKFSGAKTFAQVEEMSDFLLDADGNMRSFSEFKKKAGQVFKTYNKHWLKTEVASAAAQAQMATKWQQFESEKELFPYLRYITAGDDRVRPAHKALNGVIKHVDDKFWDENTPENGWNCRCTVVQESEAVETPNDEIEFPNAKNKWPETPDYMKHNPGKTKQLFSPEHPYFIAEKQFAKRDKNNFSSPFKGGGLPTPPKKPVDKKKATDTLIVKAKKIKLPGFAGSHTYGGLIGENLIKQRKFEKHLGYKVPDSLILNSHPASLPSRGKGWFRPSDKKVSFGKSEFDFKNGGKFKFSIASHELGHSLDNNLKIISKNMRTGKTTIKTDFEPIIMALNKEISEIADLRAFSRDLKKSFMADYFAKNDAFRLGDLKKYKKHAALLEDKANFYDTLGDMTGGSAGGGHEIAYYRRKPFKETFAHFSENYFTGNDYWKTNFPESYKLGIEYFKQLLNE